MKDRYGNLDAALDALWADGCRHLKYLEVGTYDGARAAGLLAAWLARKGNEGVSYYGFDLWEDLTPERSAAEKSKPRLPPTRDEAMYRLQSAALGWPVTLVKGDTRETLPRTAPGLPEADLVFVDGGHSLETVASDWAAVRPLVGFRTRVLFDDLYENRDDFGCGPLLAALGPPYEVTRLDPVDSYAHTGVVVRMASVRLRG